MCDVESFSDRLTDFADDSELARHGRNPQVRSARVSPHLAVAAGLLTSMVLATLPGSATAADLFVPFMDATTGRETYPAGRYVSLEDAGEGRYVLDFNLAFNPSCAYGTPERFQCPRTPAENRLAVAIRAGERGWL